MHARTLVMAVCAGGLALGGCRTQVSYETPTRHSAEEAQLFEAMGPHTRTVTTSSPEAQRYFNQGLAWMHAFNHDEAVRSFTKAAQLDDSCAMAWWGVSLCQGPNYNDSMMTDERNAAAWVALQNALERIDNTTSAERALIMALSERYAFPAPKDRSGLDQAFADAMANVWAAYPNDSDVGALYAEAMMDQMPWRLYDLDHKPAEDTPKILATLERVMQMDPANPGANHLYIHATEPSSNPDAGLVAAERLSDLVPTSGHLLHMPSHTYVKTGRWEQAIAQNIKAQASDDHYRVISPYQTIQHGYMIHNAHMRAFAAMMVGREREAMESAEDMWKDIPPEALSQSGPGVDRWMCSIYDVQKRFGRWDALLAADAPPDYLPITTAMWRAHRAIAYAAKKDFTNAERELGEFRAAKAMIAEDLLMDGDLAHRFLEVSDLFIRGEIALQQDRWNRAAKLLEEAAAIEDTLSYGEPPQWLQPVRHTLGAVYLKAGQYSDAERVYREDLAKWRRNGWSLFGLSRALEEQGKLSEAEEVRKEYEHVWRFADEQTKTSCKCIPTT